MKLCKILAINANEIHVQFLVTSRGRPTTVEAIEPGSNLGHSNLN